MNEELSVPLEELEDRLRREWERFRLFVRECRACQEAAPADWQFCASCGQRLATACPSCGAPLPPVGARFCPHCGLAIPGE